MNGAHVGETHFGDRLVFFHRYSQFDGHLELDNAHHFNVILIFGGGGGGEFTVIFSNVLFNV